MPVPTNLGSLYVELVQSSVHAYNLSLATFLWISTFQTAF